MRWETITSRDNKLIRHITRLASDESTAAAAASTFARERSFWGGAARRRRLRAVLWEQSSLNEAQAARPALLRQLETPGCRFVPRRLHRCSVPRAFWKHLPGRCLSVRWKNTPAFRRTAFHRARRCTGPRKCRNGRAHGGRFLAGRRVAFGGTADPYQPKAVRAAMGSIFRVPVYRAPANVFFAQMHGLGVDVYAAALSENAARVRRRIACKLRGHRRERGPRRAA